jgi:4'-phosphopantetheinyl transferase EntD
LKNRRFPPPWQTVQTQHGFEVHDATGFRVASVYCRDDLIAAGIDIHRHMTEDEARRIALAIARIPEFMKK